MSFLTSLIPMSVKLQMAESKLLELGKPYGVVQVEGLRLSENHKFYVRVGLEGEPFQKILIGRVKFFNDGGIRIVEMSTGLPWTDKIVELHLLDKRLTIPAAAVAAIRELWPS